MAGVGRPSISLSVTLPQKEALLTSKLFFTQISYYQLLLTTPNSILAWAAVKRDYYKGEDGNWHKKQDE